MKNFTQGQTVRLTVTFYDFNSALVNPTSVNFTVKRESDLVSTTTSGVVADSTGVYHLDIDTTAAAGIWEWRVVGTGTTPAAQQGRFYVDPSVP